ncbi:MAG: SDR family NAD(P)-dependent oxidoreductase [Propioniciclava sp.]
MTATSSLFQGHFTDKKVLVTGAASGIGLGIAQAFAESGATVRLVDRSEEALAQVATSLSTAGLDTSTRVVDVTDETQLASLIAEVGTDFGSLDVLVNNAGVITIDRLAETSTADFERVLAVNTTAAFVAAREAAPLLRAAGGGSILNAASGQAREGFIYTPGYAASKFGVMGLTQSLAKELAKDHIRVNAYCPGIVVTDMWAYNDRKWGELLGDYAPGELMQEWIDGIPLGRAAEPADVANALLFLASDAGAYITGQALNVDGGMFMN